VRTEKHYFSDIIGTFMISALASEGTRIASGYENNHPWYKAIFERDVSLGVSKVDDGLYFRVGKRF
jgi:undecaprenyl-diphosphatase